MAIKMDGHTITELKLKASDGSEVTKQLTEEGTIPTPTGTKQITTNGNGIDVTNYAAVDVNVQGGGDTPTYQEKTITANGTYTPDSGYDAMSKVIVNVSGGGGSSDIVTNWFTVKAVDIVMPANDIGNAQTAVAYFEQTYGANKVLAIFLKNSKASYASQQLVAVQPYLKSDNNASAIDGKGYRMINNEPQQFTMSSGYGCYMPEGETYTVLYYSVSI